MTPLTPLHHLQQHPRAGSQGVGIATLIFAIFFAIFLRPIEQICPDSAGPFIVSILFANSLTVIRPPVRSQFSTYQGSAG
jgi:hypothetical protein